MMLDLLMLCNVHIHILFGMVFIFTPPTFSCGSHSTLNLLHLHVTTYLLNEYA